MENGIRSESKSSLFQPKEIRNVRMLYDKGEQRKLLKRGTTKDGTIVLLSSLRGRFYLTNLDFTNIIYSSRDEHRVIQESTIDLTNWQPI